MIQAMIWKEYREHRVVWLTLAAVSAGGLYGLSRLLGTDRSMPESSARESLQGVAVLLAWTYGLVCGSMLLAGEREGGTLAFLDLLPARRLELWTWKCLIGLALLLGQVAVLTMVAIGLGIAASVLQTAGILLAMVIFGLLGMAWGLLFSARGGNVLNTIGLAIGGQIAGQLALVILVVPLQVLFQIAHPGDANWMVFVSLGMVVMTVGPIVGSARIFSRLDRLRRPGVKHIDRPPDVSRTASWLRLLWLTYAQMRGLTWGLIVFALVLGFPLLAIGPLGWPALTLFIGVLCGVTVCADEQAHGSFRFLGDQRFPLGRIWFVKVTMRFVLAVFAAFVLLLPSAIVTVYRHVQSHSTGDRPDSIFSEVLHSSLVGPVIPIAPHLTMWLLYGFSVGHLCGLLFRKSLVAAVVALGGTILLVSVWVPSLLGTGLHFWQVAGVPLILLATARLLVPAWAADRLVARGTFARLGVAFAAVALWTTGGLWYRVAEVPELPDQLDMPEFVASLPSMDKDKAGMRIRAALSKVHSLDRDLREGRRELPLLPKGAANFLKGDPSGLAIIALAHGWSNGHPELAGWLDYMLQDGWAEDLAEVPDLPLGVVENLKLLTLNSRLDKVSGARLIALVLALRGLQRQAEGREETFVDNLDIGLAVSRNIQHCSPISVALVGRATEGTWLSGLDRWLEKHRGDPRLLKRVLRTLLRHDAELPDERQQLQAEYLIARNTLEETPGELLGFIEPLPNGKAELHQAEIGATAMAWLFPWEQERHRRILRVAFQGDLPQRQAAFEWGGIALSRFGPRSKIQPRAKRQIARLRAGQLKAALRLYQAENGKPAETLDVLLPRYLSAIPRDPFDGKPFHYRLSRGERISWPKDPPQPGAVPPQPGAAPAEGEANAPPGPAAPGELPPALVPGIPGEMPPGAMPGPPGFAPKRFVPKGQGILWSVGEDGKDDGGVRQSSQDRATQFGEDIIYLVPLPPK